MIDWECLLVVLLCVLLHLLQVRTRASRAAARPAEPAHQTVFECCMGCVLLVLTCPSWSKNPTMQCLLHSGGQSELLYTASSAKSRNRCTRLRPHGHRSTGCLSLCLRITARCTLACRHAIRLHCQIHAPGGPAAPHHPRLRTPLRHQHGRTRARARVHAPQACQHRGAHLGRTHR